MSFISWYLLFPLIAVDVERHARDFMEAAKKLQLYFMGLKRENHAPTRAESLRKVSFQDSTNVSESPNTFVSSVYVTWQEIAVMEEELKTKEELIKKHSRLIQESQKLVKEQIEKHRVELEKV